jgi:hydroxylysine kinase
MRVKGPFTPDRLLTSSKPSARAGDAVGLVASAFGLEATAAYLAGERDANFHLTTTDGREFMLKIVNAAEDPDISDLQVRALRHIASRDPTLPTPRPVLSPDGRDEAYATFEGTSHVARLSTYLPGVPLYFSTPSTAQAAALGHCLARLDLALRDFRHPAADRDLLWDLRRAPKLRPLVSYIADARRRQLATTALDRYEREIAPLISAFRDQIVHNDFNPHNVLVNSDDPTLVTGVLDFGDMVHTALINDVAVAAAYQVTDAAPLERPLALVRAFHALSPLQEIEVDALFDLIAVRLVVSITISEWRASLYPENADYILRNHSRVAAALGAVANIDRDEARRRFRRACGMKET